MAATTPDESLLRSSPAVAGQAAGDIADRFARAAKVATAFI
jgi:hypothetical protein